MISSHLQFKKNLNRVRELRTLTIGVQSLTTSAIDLSDLWRAQIVMVVSALDHFIHELVRLGMIDTAKGNRPKTDAYLRFSIPLSIVESAISGSLAEVWLSEIVREKHSWQSFQDPDKIADAIRLISPIKLWDAVSQEIGLPPEDVKTRLKLIVERRNKIAHEADLEPTNPGFQYSISSSMANDTIDFIEILGRAVN